MKTPAPRRGLGGRKPVFAGRSKRVQVSLSAAVASRLNSRFPPGSTDRVRILRASLMNGLNSCGFVADAEMEITA